MLLKRFIFLFLFLMMSHVVFAQQLPGLVCSGKVKDKENNYTLNTATVSLFDADSSLVSYQITNTYGNFSFKVEQIKYPCQIRISNVGYTLKIIDIKQPVKTAIDLGEIELEPQNILLKEVEIKLSPVTLNGDTLEFNPAAFKLDSNAVLDDLLKTIPNVTVWNDGQITVNGREIKLLVVNGKPFFGTDFKVVTGNLPKNSIQKIQVYRKEESKTNPLDSTMEMNILLKKGIDRGFFGKIAIGAGTGKHYEAEGNINYFTKRLQLSLAATSNSTNKVANDMETLLKNSTFKSSITDMDYQSNFKLPGVNTVHSSGTNFKYDFLDKKIPGWQNELSGSYFRQYLDVKEQAETNSLRMLNMNEQNAEFDNTHSDRKTDGQSVALKYNLNNNINSFVINLQKSVSSEEEQRQLSTLVRDAMQQTLSSYLGQSQSDYTHTKYRLSAYYSYEPQSAKSDVKRKTFLPFIVSYKGNLSDNDGSLLVNAAFTSVANPVNNMAFNRRRISDRQLNDQQLDLTLHGINDLLFGKYRSSLQISLLAGLHTNRERDTEKVSDMPGTAEIINTYLSNVSTENLNKFYYGLDLSKSYGRQLTDRYDKSMSFSFRPGITNISFASHSQKVMQQIRKRNTSFFPEAGFTVYNYFYGKHRTNFSAKYSTEINFPNLQQFAPLTDSTAVYNLKMGNPNLSPERLQSFQLSFSREFTRTVNTFTYNLNASMLFSSDKIADSIWLSPDNRQTVFPVNLAAYQQFMVGAQLRKSLKFKSSDLKFQFDGGLSRTYMPAYINADFVLNKQQFRNLMLNIGYGYKDKIVLELKEQINHYRSEQAFYAQRFDGTTFTHTVNVLYRVTKKLSLNSNVNFNTNQSAGLPDTRFTIWNVYVAQRLFKQQNAELRISGLDLLNQNNNVINRVGINSFSTTTRNSLQRYVLFSVSYYPRKFGR